VTASPASPDRFAATAGALGWATVVSALGVVPAVFRCSSGVGGLAAWLTLCGAVALVAGPTAALLRSLRSSPRTVWALPLCAVLALPALTVFGQVLHRSTHHRPLGAATFAVVAAALLLGLLVVTTRLLGAAERGKDGARLARGVLLLAAALALAVEIALIRSALRQADSGLTHILLDGGLVVLATALASSLPVPRLSRWVGLALWAAAVGACSLSLRRSPVRQVVSDRAPVLAAVATSVLTYSGRP
jgi:hypothetical protein